MATQTLTNLPRLSLSDLIAMTEDEREHTVAMRKRAIVGIASTCIKCIEHFTPRYLKGDKMFAYEFHDGQHPTIFWNVDRAQRIIKDEGIQPFLLTLEQMRMGLLSTDADIQHIAHIPPKAMVRPAILARVPGWPHETIIDGSHRMKALHHFKVEMAVFVLNEEQSTRALFTPEDWAIGRDILRRLHIDLDC